MGKVLQMLLLRTFVLVCTGSGVHKLVGQGVVLACSRQWWGTVCLHRARASTLGFGKTFVWACCRKWWGSFCMSMVSVGYIVWLGRVNVGCFVVWILGMGIINTRSREAVSGEFVASNCVVLELGT